jgi:hypothetical protein
MLVLVLVLAATGSAHASTTVNVNPANPTGNNQFPFGRADIWPKMGFVYKDVPAFDLKTGDTIAFDLGAQNDVNIQLQIEMAATTANGGDVPGTYTTVVPSTQVPLNPKGNAVMGDYELRFTAQAPFHFAGGGMIIRFSNPGGAFALDTTPTAVMFNLADSTDASGFFVERFYHDVDGLPPYDSIDPGVVAGFRLTLADVPVPPTSTTPTPASTTTTTTTTKKKCKKKKHKRAAASAKKKCKKKRH